MPQKYVWINTHKDYVARVNDYLYGQAGSRQRNILGRRFSYIARSGYGGGDEAEADREVQRQAQGRGGEGAVPKVHVREAQAGIEVPGGRQDVQHMRGQGTLRHVQAVQEEEEEGRKESQRGTERDLQ